ALWAALDALRLSLHAPDIGLYLPDIGLLLVPGSRLQLALVRARRGEIAVAPWVALHRARIRIEIENARHRAVQKLAVVGDDQHRRAIALNKVLDPSQRLHIQGVGWLVKQ